MAASVTSSKTANVEISEHAPMNVTEYQMILIKPNLSTGIKNQNLKIVRTNITPSNATSTSIFFENANSLYFVTHLDHPGNLTVDFNLRTHSNKTYVSRYVYQVSKLPESRYTDAMDITFKNLNFKQFLDKKGAILDFFIQNSDDDAAISGVFDRTPNLEVVLVNTAPFSTRTRNNLIKKSCKPDLKIAELEVVPCSIKLRTLEASERVENVSMSVDLDSNVVMSSSSAMNVNYILLAGFICIQLLLLV